MIGMERKYLGLSTAAILLLAASACAQQQRTWTKPEWAKPVAERVAAIPNLDVRLSALEKALDSARDKNSLSATTALYTLDILKDVKAYPAAYGPFPNRTPPGRSGKPLPYSMEPPKLLSDYISSMIPFAIDLDGELARAEQIATALKAGRDPMAGAVGDVHLAYRSKLDGMLMPYRIYVPKNYDAKRSWPLVIFLHGAMCDENSFMGANQLQPAAERYGYLLAAVNGRGPVSGYNKESGAEQDVLDVVAQMQRYYRVDPNRIYLMGHSMGGFGTWRIGLTHRDIFAAIAPESGTRAMDYLDAQLASGRKIPILMTVGGKDTSVPPGPALEIYPKLKDAGFPVKLVEYPEDEHETTFFSSTPEVFAWFEKYSR